VNTRTVTRYLHGETDELSKLWPPEAKQQEVYAYALYEVSVDLEVDMNTGRSRIIAVDGVPLSKIGEFR